MECYEKNSDIKEYTKKVLGHVNKCQQVSSNNIEYRCFTDSIQEVSGAALVGLNLVSEKDKKKTTVKAVSGTPRVLSRLMKAIGYNLEGTEWEAKYEEKKINEIDKLIQFSSFKEIGYYGSLSRLAPALKTIEKLLPPGDLYAMEFEYQGEFLGIITLIMPSGKALENKELIELYIHQIAGTIKRLRAENKLQQKISALGESEAKFRAYMEKAPLGIFVADYDGHYLEVNQAACQMSGYTEEELLHLTIPDFLATEFMEKGMKVFERLLKEGYAEDEVMVRKKNGATFWIGLSTVRVNDKKVIAFCQDITDRKNAEESLKYQFRFEKMIANISSFFASQPSEQLKQSINHALGQIGEFFQVDRSYMFLFSDDGKQMSYRYEWCAQGIEAQIDRWQSVPVDAFPWQVGKIRKGKHVYIPDVDDLPPEAEAEKNNLKAQDIHSLLSIPLMKNGSVVGFLGFDAVKEKKVWTDNHVMLLTLVAELISNVYTRNQAEEKVRYQSFHDGLTGLYNRAYLEKEMERLDTERQLPIGIIMADLNGLKLTNDTFGHAAGDEMLKQTAEILKDSCRREDIIARWGGDEFVVFLPQTTEEDAKAICQRMDDKSKETDVKNIPLSLALGQAIKNHTSKDLEEILKEAEANMYQHKLAGNQRVNRNVLDVLLKKLERKSFETESHYSVMQDVAHKIGKKIRLSQSKLGNLKTLISLHDIGKINISEEILTKKGPLLEKEWKMMKKHPETGYRILRATKGFAQVAEDVLSHHERWDGSGYPQGLKGEEIPLLPRITAIADAYEVMSSGRVYKKALSQSEVIDELKRCAGFQFDPKLTEIFLAILEKEKKANDS